MTSEEPVEGRCNAQTRDGGHCTQWPVGGSERCRMHGGNSTGGDGGAREGAGAPPENTNRSTHGAYTEQHNLYDNEFSEREVDLADQIFAGYCERYEEVHGSAPPLGFEMRLFKIAVNSVTEMRVDNWYTDKPDDTSTGTPHIDREKHVSEGGQAYYRYKKSPATAAIKHLSDYNHRWLKNFNLLPDAESQMADAAEEGADSWREFVTTYTDQ